MSRRHSSKSRKNRNQNKLQVQENSIGAAIFAKNPDLADALAEKAQSTKNVTNRSQGGPKIMPGDLTPKTNFRRASTSNHSRKTKEKRAKENKSPAKEPLNKPLQVIRTVSKQKEENTNPSRITQNNPHQINKREDLLNAFMSIERSDGIDQLNDEIDQATAATLDDFECNFVKYIESKKSNGQPFYITIGFDFGTSSTKIVVNAPYGDGRSFAFLVPDFFQMNEHPHLWKCVLFQNQSTNTFSLAPSINSQQIKNLKTSLMSQPNKVLSRSEDSQLIAEHLCVAYIGLTLRYLKGWVWKNFKSYFGLNPDETKIIWEINFGVPAATLDKTKDFLRFEKVFYSAWKVSEEDNEVNAEAIDAAFLFAHTKRDEFASMIHLRPEVSAEAVGLLKANLADFGTYVLIDIGASTLDICVFNYADGDEIEKQVLFVSEVYLLGAESPKWIEKINSEGLKKFSDDDLHLAIRESIGTPIVYTKTEKNPQSQAWHGTLPIIVAGGGRDSEVHRLQLRGFKADWIRGSNTKEVTLIDPVKPFNLQTKCQSNEYHRLSVAWGLSISDTEFVKVDLPSSVPDQLKKSVDYSQNFISKDDV